MSTVIRNEVSSKNKYWIPKHRTLELKHYCLQYPEWKKTYLIMEQKGIPTGDFSEIRNKSKISNPTERVAILKAELKSKMDMVELASMKADPLLQDYILKAVTEGFSYVTMSMNYGIPCSKDTFYDRYRRFFFELSCLRQ